MKSKITFIKKPELFATLKGPETPFFAVIDEKLKSHLPDWMLFSPCIFWLKNPEAQKNVNDFSQICEFFLEKGITRNTKLMAMGGGATTDLTGQVAASLLRGIKWTAIPTTLLGMVDASIGGKVGLNMPQGKNLIGAFHAPENIYICHEFLSTLSEIEKQSGCGEILKYAFLSVKINDLINSGAHQDVLIKECALLKQEIVEEDFTEQGNRILLNFGHTLGHAFESHLKIPHGLAVAMGIKYLFEIYQQTELTQEWEKLAVSLNLPLEKLTLANYPKFSFETFKSFIKFDKKKHNSLLKLVMVKAVGDSFIQETSLEEFFKKIEAHEAFH